MIFEIKQEKNEDLNEPEEKVNLVQSKKSINIFFFLETATKRWFRSNQSHPNHYHW
jgi:hypothetical protein